MRDNYYSLSLMSFLPLFVLFNVPDSLEAKLLFSDLSEELALASRLSVSDLVTGRLDWTLARGDSSSALPWPGLCSTASSGNWTDSGLLLEDCLRLLV